MHAHDRTARPAGARGPPEPSVGADASQLYVKIAEREARRDAARMRSGSASFAGRGHPASFRAWSARRWSAEEHAAETASPAWRFLQVASVFGAAVWVASRFMG
jgi:hypothetical protein